MSPWVSAWVAEEMRMSGRPVYSSFSPRGAYNASYTEPTAHTIRSDLVKNTSGLKKLFFFKSVDIFWKKTIQLLLSVKNIICSDWTRVLSLTKKDNTPCLVPYNSIHIMLQTLSHGTLHCSEISSAGLLCMWTWSSSSCINHLSAEWPLSKPSLLWTNHGL